MAEGTQAAEQRTALITGGARGIGRSVAQQMHDAGWSVAIADLEADLATATADEIADDGGAPVLAAATDVTKSEDVEALMKTLDEQLGGLDVLVNNAGAIFPGPANELSDDAWEAAFAVHAGGAFKCSRAAYPLLSRSASAAIVNISSVAGIFGVSRRGGYGAAKAAVDSMTRMLAVEWADVPIRVNSVAPGHIRTDMTDDAIAKGVITQRHLDARYARIPLGRFGAPNEIAAAVTFLASPAASYINGAVLVADGGLSINGDELKAG